MTRILDVGVQCNITAKCSLIQILLITYFSVFKFLKDLCFYIATTSSGVAANYSRLVISDFYFLIGTRSSLSRSSNVS